MTIGSMSKRKWSAEKAAREGCRQGPSHGALTGPERMRLGQRWSLTGRPHSYLDTSSQERGFWVPGPLTQSSGYAELHPVPPGPRGRILLPTP